MKKSNALRFTILSTVLIFSITIIAQSVQAEPFAAFSPRNMERLEWYYDQAKGLYNNEKSIEFTTPDGFQGFNFTEAPILSIKNNNFYANDIQIKGIFVNWFIHEKTTDRDYFRREFTAMKEIGIIGVSLEVPWADCEAEENTYMYPKYLDAAIEAAAEQGLWVSLLLSPHYTPDWLYEKYGDIYIYDADGNRYYWDNFGTDVDKKASYINFSYHSPAVEDQIEWQQEAVQHYAKHPNIFNFFVGNEQIHDRKVLINYSSWAEHAWTEWLKLSNYKAYDMPHDLSAEQADLWQEFRTTSLNKYLDKVYKEVKRAAPRNIPVGHRMLLYHSFSSEAPMYAYQPGQFSVGMDFLGNDNYSFAPSTCAAQLSYDKPIFIGETSLQGSWSEEGIYMFLMTQFYLGADIQSVYVWNKKPYDYALTTIAGELTEKGKGLKKAAQEINSMPAFDAKKPKILIVLPNTQFYLHTDDFKSYQYKLDAIFDTLLDRGILPAFIWENDLHYENQKKSLYLEKFDYMLLPFTGDYMQAPHFYKWVNNGGIAYKTVLFEYEREAWEQSQKYPYGCTASQKGEICTIENLDVGLFRLDTAFNLHKFPVDLLHLIFRHIQEHHNNRM